MERKPKPEPEPVTVVHEGSAGPYETVTLHSNVAGALNSFFNDGGALPPFPTGALELVEAPERRGEAAPGAASSTDGIISDITEILKRLSRRPIEPRPDSELLADLGRQLDQGRVGTKRCREIDDLD